MLDNSCCAMWSGLLFSSCLVVLCVKIPQVSLFIILSLITFIAQVMSPSHALLR